MDKETTQEVNLPADLAKRYAEATTDAQRLAVLQEFAVQRGAQSINKQEAVAVTDEQFRTLLDKIGQLSAAEAKTAINTVADEAQRKYGLSADEAQEVAERGYKTAEMRHTNAREDAQAIAEVIRGMYFARKGMGDVYKRAIESEAAYCKRKYGITTRAMTLGTDSTGGYLAPQLFSDRLYENIQRASLVRKYATIIPMQRNEVINFPTMTAGLSAGQVAEGGAGTNSQPTFSQKQLVTKKLMTKTRPIAIELIEKANPAITQLLMQHATIEILKKEDELVFGTSGNGIRATATNEVSRAGTAAAFSAITFDDYIDMESELAPEYLMGDDVEGSGLITGVPRYWLSHNLYQAGKKLKDTTNAYLEDAMTLRKERTINGYNAHKVLSLPSTPANNTKVAVFGNLAHVWCGVEAGFMMDLLTEGTIDDGGSSVSLAETAQAAVRVIEFFDNVVIDAEAFSQFKCAT